MIVRVFRARVRPGKAAEFERLHRTQSLDLVRSQPGLVTWYAGRPVGSNRDEFVLVTIWRDLEALRAFAGDQIDHAIIPDDEFPLIAESHVQHYETYADPTAAS